MARSQLLRQVEYRSNLLRAEPLTALPRPERYVRGHRPGEEIRDLHDHADATPQLLRRQFTVVLTIETHGPAGWLIEAVAAKSERAWCEAIRNVSKEEKGITAE